MIVNSRDYNVPSQGGHPDRFRPETLPVSLYTRDGIDEYVLTEQSQHRSNQHLEQAHRYKRIILASYATRELTGHKTGTPKLLEMGISYEQNWVRLSK